MDNHSGQIFIAAILACIVTALTIAAIKPVAGHVRLLDQPGGRKQHSGPIPVIGGIGIALGFIASLLYLSPDFSGLSAILIGSGILFVVGIMDDAFTVDANWKLFAQILAACIVVFWGGIKIEGLGNLFYSGHLSLGPFGQPVTVFAIVAYVNAFNMADGVDGLAGMLGLVTTAGLFAAAVLSSRFVEAGLLAALGSCLLTFLFFNLQHPLRPKQCVFLGDNGSIMIGFLLACLLIHLVTSRSQGPIITSTTALWIVGYPLIDLTIVSVRRILKGRSPFTADREHFHHILLAADFSTNQTVVIIAAIVTSMISIGLTGQYIGVAESIMFSLFGITAFVAAFLLTKAWRVTRLLSHTAGHDQGKPD